MIFRIFELNGRYCTQGSEGQRLYEQIYPLLKKGEEVILDFEGVEIFTSAYFNYAIGQLLKDLSPDSLNQNLEILNLQGWGNQALRNIISNAKEYYRNKLSSKT